MQEVSEYVTRFYTFPYAEVQTGTLSIQQWSHRAQ